MLSDPQTLLNSRKGKEQLVLLTRVQGPEVKLINRIARNCGYSEGITEAGEEDFYKTCLHPQDYPDYVAQLGSLQKDDTRKIYSRLKDADGNWHRFCFKSRIYGGLPETKGSVVLSIVEEAEGEFEKEEISSKERTPSYTALSQDFEHLVNSLDEAFCVGELILNEEGQPIDFLFLQSNKALEIQVPFYKSAVGKTIKELRPDAKDSDFRYMHQVVETGKPLRYELFFEGLQDSWFEFYTFKTADNQNCRLALIFKNVTEKKRAQERILKAKAELEKAKAELEEKVSDRTRELKESQQLLQTVFDTTNAAVAVFETLYNKDGSIKDFKFIKVNRVLLEMYLDQDPTGCTYLETSKYGVEMGMFDALKSVMETEKPLDEEFYLGRGGYHHWFRLTARHQQNLLIASIEDISERKAEAEHLKEHMRFREELGRASQETILIVNLSEMKIRYINKDILPEAGITKERVEGMALVEMIPHIHPQDREKLLEMHKRILKAREDEVLEIEVRGKVEEASWEWFNVRGKILLRRDPSWVEEYVLLITNISDQKKTENALLEAQKHSIKGEVARTLAHELRNPIASIRMVGQALSAKADDFQNPESKKFLEILSRSTETLNKLVTNLLTSSNYSPAVLRNEDLAQIVENTLRKAADRVYLSGIDIIRKFSGSYPVLADKEKLQIALLNIVVNASEATKPGEGRITIEITEEEKSVVLSISDNGHGMEQDQTEKLFQAFYSRKAHGVGVGLNAVKNIIEEHDAEIKVLSEPGKGATFLITFLKPE